MQICWTPDSMRCQIPEKWGTGWDGTFCIYLPVALSLKRNVQQSMAFFILVCSPFLFFAISCQACIECCGVRAVAVCGDDSSSGSLAATFTCKHRVSGLENIVCPW